MPAKSKTTTPAGDKPVRSKRKAVGLLSGKPDAKRDKSVAKVKEPKAVVVETLRVPAALLLAGEAVAAKAGTDMPSLHGVLIHQVDKGRARVVARDNARLFVASFPLGSQTVPGWLKTGLLVQRDALKARVTLLTKVADAQFIVISHAPGAPHAELSDQEQTTVMRVGLAPPERFPSYDRVMAAASFSSMDYEGEVSGKDWQAVGFSSRSLKHCSEIAKVLEGGLPKDKRPTEGMVIRAFNGGNENAPKVFDFPQWPGALLVLQPIPVGAMPISVETVAVLAPAVKLTVAALRAHAKRWIQRSETATSEAEKAEHLARAANFQGRVDALLTKAPTVKQELLALEGKTPDPDSEADNAEQDAADAVRMSADPPDDDEEEGEVKTVRGTDHEPETVH